MARTLTKIVPIDSIKPHPRNPNGHPAEQVKLLADSARQYEQVRNIVVWNGLILAGEGFWRGAKKAGLKEIEIKDVSKWPEAKALAYMYDDNALGQKSSLDAEGALLLVEMAEKGDALVVCISDRERADMVRQAKKAKRKKIKLVSDPGALVGESGPSAVAEPGKANKFPLAIVVDAQTSRAWAEYKQKIERQDDTAAFLTMFEAMKSLDVDGEQERRG